MCHFHFSPILCVTVIQQWCLNFGLEECRFAPFLDLMAHKSFQILPLPWPLRATEKSRNWNFFLGIFRDFAPHGFFLPFWRWEVYSERALILKPLIVCSRAPRVDTNFIYCGAKMFALRLRWSKSRGVGRCKHDVNRIVSERDNNIFCPHLMRDRLNWIYGLNAYHITVAVERISVHNIHPMQVPEPWKLTS